MKSHVITIIKFLIGWPLALLALYYILTIISPHFPEILPHLQHLDVFLLVLGVSCFISFYTIRGFIWHEILNYYSYKIPFRESLFLWAFSELKRYIPGNIWSFLGRSVIFHEKGVSKKHLATSFVSEAQFFIFGGLIVSFLTVSFVFKQYGITHSLIADAALVGLILGGTLFFAGNRYVLPLLPHKVSHLLEHILPPFAFTQNLRLICLSSVALLLYGVGNYFVASSIFILPVNLFWMLGGLFVLAFLIGYLSIITPTGLGVREGLSILFLSKYVSTSLAGFLALFARIVLMGSEVLFIALAYLIFRLKRLKPLNVSSYFILKIKYVFFVLMVSILFIIYFSVVNFLRYDNFYTGRYDLGNMAQTVWNTTQGRVFLFSNPNGNGEISRLAFHADFFLVLLSPLYLLWSNPKTLLLIQTAGVAAGAFFVFLLAKDILKSGRLSVLLAIAYLLNPALERATIYDFHAVTIAPTLLLGAFYFLKKEKYVYFALFAILAGITKEQIWVIIALFGLYLFFFQKKYIFGAITAVLSLTIFYLLIWQVIPHFLGSEHFALSYFSNFGAGPTRIIKNVILSPQKTLSVIVGKSRLDFLNQLLLPLGYLPLLSPFYLVFASPDLLIDLISSNAQLHQIYYQYSSAITPFLFLSSIYTLSWISSRFPKTKSVFLPSYITIAMLAGAYFYSPLPGARDPNLDMFTKPVVNRNIIDNFLRHIPSAYTVTVTNNIGSHLTNRRYVYAVPVNLTTSDMVIFLINDSDSQPSPKELNQMVASLRKNPHYRLDYKLNNFIVFKRTSLN